MIIKLMRHGESKTNSGELLAAEYGDYRIPLSNKGEKQVCATSAKLEPDFFRDALVYCSPFLRAKQTINLVLKSLSLDTKDDIYIHEDIRLREIDTGYGNRKEQQRLRAVHGLFYYRYEGGESPADCFDRVSSFIDSMIRQSQRTRKKKVFISCHSMVIRCFVMRYMHLTVDEFNSIEPPDHCDVVTIAPKDELPKSSFTYGQWGSHGLRQRKKDWEFSP
ncbi:histidine phosphatase family protein [Nostoc sp. LEGE 12447]|uniref:histidine phosphatase family protein n=1 Tax=Nostoc sp. LEGE 12447 TaxID=1828640 RepID=UPI00188376F6|nr:histidine phosphatase family protein [Nostoc sp. LEGE 12447]MBE9003387.1 histidine phosphatase family protein [Nostoc sp. LEGE 12447]